MCAAWLLHMCFESDLYATQVFLLMLLFSRGDLADKLTTAFNVRAIAQLITIVPTSASIVCAVL